MAEAENYRISRENADRLYAFVRLYSDYMAVPRDYGTGTPVSMVDVHTLEEICRHPGITVTGLASALCRTKGTVSGTVSRLDVNGYIKRVRSGEDAKVQNLHPTDKGLALNAAHQDYDERELVLTAAALTKDCAPAELDSFFKVLGIYASLFQES